MTYYDYNKRTPEEEANATAAYEKRREQERNAAEAHRIATTILIGDICRELNKPVPEWSIMSYDPAEYIDRWPDLIHKDGRKIDFSDGKGVQREARKRLNISGHWPQNGDNGPIMSLYQVGEKSPSIEVSRDRGAAVIAREIVRRFLPEYTRIWLKCQEKINATNRHLADTEHNFRKLCKVLGIDPVKVSRHGLQDQAKISVYEYFRGAGYGEITVTGSSVDFHLRSLPLDVAEEIAGKLWDIHSRAGAHK